MTRSSATASAPGVARLDPHDLDLRELVDHITALHHARLRSAVAHLRALAADVLADDAANDGAASSLGELVRRLTIAIEHQIDRDERELFPLLCAGRGGCSEVRQALSANQQSHLEIAAWLRRVHVAASSYVAVAGTTHRYRTLMQELARLESDTAAHAHVETTVLARRTAW